jgi:uncharacterized protein YndB with AHSA1/START domain
MTSPDGTAERRDDGVRLRFERRLRHPIDRVWAALTEPAELEAWLASAEVELVPGGRFELRWLNAGDDTVHSVGTVTALEAPRLLEYTSSVHGVLRWSLREEGDDTVLTFVNDSPAGPEEVALTLSGWHIHLEHLEDALEGRRVDWARWSAEHLPRWEELHAGYA